jgi:hypothetical protein
MLPDQRRQRAEATSHAAAQAEERLRWMPKEGADRLARYPEKERGEVVTRALALGAAQTQAQPYLCLCIGVLPLTA